MRNNRPSELHCKRNVWNIMYEVGEFPCRNILTAGLLSQSKRVRTPVALLCSLSGKVLIPPTFISTAMGEIIPLLFCYYFALNNPRRLLCHQIKKPKYVGRWAEKFIWWHHIYSWWLFFLAMGSNHDGWKCVDHNGLGDYVEK